MIVQVLGKDNKRRVSVVFGGNKIEKRNFKEDKKEEEEAKKEESSQDDEFKVEGFIPIKRRKKSKKKETEEEKEKEKEKEE